MYKISGKILGVIITCVIANVIYEYGRYSAINDLFKKGMQVIDPNNQN